MADLCGQPTANGTPCKKRCYGGTDRCWTHLALDDPDMQRPGRPGKLLTEETIGQLVAMLRMGNYVHVACRAAGISLDTYEAWLRQGRTGEQPYAELVDRVERARAEGQARHVTLISQAAASDWHAASWLLERQHPQLWGAVSVRLRTDEPAAPETQEPTAPDDPFAEVDELAARRRHRN
jgi:hypothetical protein